MSPPQDAIAPVAIGEVLAGKYRVERILGIGGMGVVVAATHLQLGQLVALKFVLPQAMTNPILVERFVREARAAVRLRSEHVARVVDVGTLDGGAPFIVMEFLEGVDLGARIETLGPLTVTDAADYVLQACEAVAEAHALGIIHRDLKPKNLFLATRVDGRALVKVLDFGISKLTGRDGERESGEMSLTRTTEVMGSPNYMSPEQLRSARDVDLRTDIWALGVILYELLAGVVPFRAETVTQLCAMVLQDEPRPLPTLRSDVPPELSGVVLHCLAKHPKDRFQNVAHLAMALEPFAGEAGRGAGMRIQSILGGGGGSGAAAHQSGPAPRIVVTPGTSVSWDATELAPGAQTLRRRRVRYGLAGTAAFIALTAAVTGGAWLGSRSRHAGDVGLASSSTSGSGLVLTTIASVPTPPALSAHPENESVADPLASANATVDAGAFAAADAGRGGATRLHAGTGHGSRSLAAASPPPASSQAGQPVQAVHAAPAAAPPPTPAAPVQAAPATTPPPQPGDGIPGVRR